MTKASTFLTLSSAAAFCAALFLCTNVAWVAERQVPLRLPPVASTARVIEDPNISLVAYEAKGTTNHQDTFRHDASESDMPSAFKADPLLTPAPLVDFGAYNLYPIDLSNALALGGASNLFIRLARERAVEAQARHLEACSLWLPSFRAGIGWNKHDGLLQQTEGDILEVSRNSLFVGGGLGLGQAPLAAGAGGPMRMFVNLSLADAIFEPLVTQAQLDARCSAINRSVNDNLLNIASAYFDLLESHAKAANAEVSKAAADQLLQITTLYRDEGAGNQSDVDRALVQHSLEELALRNAQRMTHTQSARLVRQLHLDGRTLLTPVEQAIVPMDIIDPAMSVDKLLIHGLSNRPELAQHQAIVRATIERVNQEHWRPWLPNVQVGTSFGAFGGGRGSEIENQADRSDIDVLAYWELRNLGIGTSAIRQQHCSRMRQAQLESMAVRDQVMAQIVTAAEDANSFREQVQIAQQTAAAARSSYRLNLQRVRQRQGSPIELLQSITALKDSLDAYTVVTANYNRSQLRLLRAIGKPPHVASEFDKDMNISRHDKTVESPAPG